MTHHASPVRTDGWVQPILVAKTGTHLATVRAAAQASVLAFLGSRGLSSWQEWLAGPFTKTVRRTSTGKLETATATEPVTARVEVADADGTVSVALAYAPSRYSELPREVVKAQVSGTDLARTVDQPEPGPFEVWVEQSLTTGKASAQAAHAAWIWMLHRLQDNPEQVAEWAALGAPLTVRLTGPAALAAAETEHADDTAYGFVRDAGFTEVAPRTLTAAAVPMRR
ncbi:peptidyl-tRNA hydrolase [Pseudactinotalea terrae]|uniref:peptidyl-tRNA hydrolase n=1 Tax=Pseudactinotalea terrae TaxID=1743262 RepID=UPI001390A8E0|nr:peptidyl-tRNA hydrolase [Pseudactinotalea terrae]